MNNNSHLMIFLENEIWAFFDAHGMGDEDHRLLSAEIAYEVVIMVDKGEVGLTTEGIIKHISFVLYNVMDKNFAYNVELFQKIRSLMPCKQF